VSVSTDADTDAHYVQATTISFKSLWNAETISQSHAAVVCYRPRCSRDTGSSSSVYCQHTGTPQSRYEYMDMLQATVSEKNWYCGRCNEEDNGCDHCLEWFDWQCVGLDMSWVPTSNPRSIDSSNSVNRRICWMCTLE